MAARIAEKAVDSAKAPLLVVGAWVFVPLPRTGVGAVSFAVVGLAAGAEVSSTGAVVPTGALLPTGAVVPTGADVVFDGAATGAEVDASVGDGDSMTGDGDPMIGIIDTPGAMIGINEERIEG